MIVRAARPDDHATIRQIVTAAFGRPDEAAIVEAVRAGGEVLVELVAEVAGGVAGHALFNRMRCAPAVLVAGLAPLAVSPDRQHRGLGAGLVGDGLAACRALGARACVVLGDPAYYGRFGFAPAGPSIVSRYSPSPAFQALWFGDRSGPPLRVSYPEAFDADHD